MKYVRNALASVILVATAMTAHAGPGQGGVVAPNSIMFVVLQ